MASFPIASCRDDFTDNSQSPMWADSFTTGSATKAETGGQAVLTLPSSTAGAHSAFYTSSATYDLTGDSCFFTVGTMVATGVAATAYFQLFADSLNQVYWRQVSNTITARYTLGGVDVQLFTAAWSATTYKYLRIRESGGTIFWDSSTNGTTWTNRASNGGLPFVTSVFVQFGASCGNVASPGSLKLDEVNLILPAPSSTWRETTADWSISNRLRSVTLASDGGKQGVLVTADTMDSSRVLGGTLHYFAGPLGSSSGGFLQLTEYASLVLAEASAFPIPLNGRVDLPILVDARYMRLYHRSTDASSHTIYEYVPRRLVQADDIEAESIKAINISAGAITADKISVGSLSAITASMGSLHMDGPIDITTGSLIGGGGVVTLDVLGLALTVGASYADLQSYRLVKADGTTFGGMGGAYTTGTGHGVEVRARSITGEGSDVLVGAASPSGKLAAVYLQVQSGLTNYPALTVSTDDTTNAVVIDALNTSGTIRLTSPTTITQGLNVGTATGAAAGQISTSGSIGIGDVVQANIRGFFKGVDATSSNYALFANSSAGTNLFWVRNDGAVLLSKSGGAVGFYGSTPAAKPTVTGSRSANAALASLLTALAGLGLLVDSST